MTQEPLCKVIRVYKDGRQQAYAIPYKEALSMARGVFPQKNYRGSNRFEFEE